LYVGSWEPFVQAGLEPWSTQSQSPRHEPPALHHKFNIYDTFCNDSKVFWGPGKEFQALFARLLGKGWPWGPDPHKSSQASPSLAVNSCPGSE
jgi:hypothetical protein